MANKTSKGLTYEQTRELSRSIRAEFGSDATPKKLASSLGVSSSSIYGWQKADAHRNEVAGLQAKLENEVKKVNLLQRELDACRASYEADNTVFPVTQPNNEDEGN